MKPFKFGFIVGRFHHIHIGHEKLIDFGLKMCDQLLVMVGSSQESGTLRNPFDVIYRIELIRKVYGNNLKIGYLPDLTNENDITYEWGKFVLQHVRQWAVIHGIEGQPDVTIYGNDENRANWYDPNDIKNMSQLIVPRAEINISATALREAVVRNHKAKWEAFVNPKLRNEYLEIRRRLLQVPEYKEMLMSSV
jgi:bifunctional NMN adenylyltransferase/nudix hydrolase